MYVLTRSRGSPWLNKFDIILLLSFVQNGQILGIGPDLIHAVEASFFHNDLQERVAVKGFDSQPRVLVSSPNFRGPHPYLFIRVIGIRSNYITD